VQEAVVTAGVMVPLPQQRGSITTSSALLSTSSKCHIANPRQPLGSGSFGSKPLSSGEQNEANIVEKCFKSPRFQLKAVMSKAVERASEGVFMTEDTEILEDKGEGYNNVNQDQNQEKEQQIQDTDSPSAQYVLKAAYFQSDDEDALSDSIDPCF
jgi:hypothetical protein